jgi:hypothetical protein
MHGGMLLLLQETDWCMEGAFVNKDARWGGVPPPLSRSAGQRHLGFFALAVVQLPQEGGIGSAAASRHSLLPAIATASTVPAPGAHEPFEDLVQPLDDVGGADSGELEAPTGVAAQGFWWESSFESIDPVLIPRVCTYSRTMGRRAPTGPTDAKRAAPLEGNGPRDRPPVSTLGSQICTRLPAHTYLVCRNLGCTKPFLNASRVPRPAALWAHPRGEQGA